MNGVYMSLLRKPNNNNYSEGKMHLWREHLYSNNVKDIKTYIAFATFIPKVYKDHISLHNCHNSTCLQLPCIFTHCLHKPRAIIPSHDWEITNKIIVPLGSKWQIDTRVLNVNTIVPLNSDEASSKLQASILRIVLALISQASTISSHKTIILMQL